MTVALNQSEFHYPTAELPRGERQAFIDAFDQGLAGLIQP